MPIALHQFLRRQREGTTGDKKSDSCCVIAVGEAKREREGEREGESDK
jgi:hypothetical protein